jgi:hypothetical protein
MMRKTVRAGLVAVGVLLLNACGLNAVQMNVVVFNYWPRALADVYVDGQHVGAGYGGTNEQSGTGGKISCCHSVKAGNINVRWVLGGGEHDPMRGKEMFSDVQLKQIKPNADYLGVYLYEDGTVALDTARGIPDNKPRAAAKADS